MDNTSKLKPDNLKQLEFEKALTLRNFEIDNFWKRGWFFGALLLALISAYYQNKTMNKQLFPPVTISFLIALVSLFQSLMNRGSKYWQERWEYVTKNKESSLKIDLTKTKNYDKTEKYYIDACILAKNENCLVVGRRFSVSKLTILIWDLIFWVCLFVWISDACAIWSPCMINLSFTVKIISYHLFLLGYILFFWLYKERSVYGKFSKELSKMSNGNQNKNKYYEPSEAYVNDSIDKTTRELLLEEFV